MVFACTSALHALPLVCTHVTPYPSSPMLTVSPGISRKHFVQNRYLHTHIQTGNEDGALAERLICCHFEVSWTTQWHIITHMLHICNYSPELWEVCESISLFYGLWGKLNAVYTQYIHTLLPQNSARSVIAPLYGATTDCTCCRCTCWAHAVNITVHASDCINKTFTISAMMRIRLTYVRTYVHTYWLVVTSKVRGISWNGAKVLTVAVEHLRTVRVLQGEGQGEGHVFVMYLQTYICTHERTYVLECTQIHTHIPTYVLQFTYYTNTGTHACTDSRPLPHPHSTAVAQTFHGIIDDLIEDFKEFSAHFVHLRGLAIVQPGIVHH